MKSSNFLSIGDVAMILDVEVHTVRYWEKEFGFILKPPRTPGSHRQYGPEELVTLKKIWKMLKEEQYSIAGARKKFEKELRSVEIADPKTTITDGQQKQVALS